MSNISPYTSFWNWVFDGIPNSPIPNPDILLKYNSPITCTYLLKCFLNNAKFNLYLNKYLNNINVRYIKLDELFKFIKQAVKDFKIQRKTIFYSQYEPKNILLEKVKQKIPLLKSYEADLLCNIIEKSPERNSIYSSFGLEKIKKEKTKNKGKNKKISEKEFLKENFNVLNI